MLLLKYHCLSITVEDSSSFQQIYNCFFCYTYLYKTVKPVYMKGCGFELKHPPSSRRSKSILIFFRAHKPRVIIIRLRRNFWFELCQYKGLEGVFGGVKSFEVDSNDLCLGRHDQIRKVSSKFETLFSVSVSLQVLLQWFGISKQVNIIPFGLCCRWRAMTLLTYH